MSKPRVAYHHGDLRNALISAAIRLIETSGEAAFSLRAAARDVGVSPNAAYRHFEDKSALLNAVAASGLEQMASRMRKAMDRAAESDDGDGPAVARFKAVGRGYLEFAMAHPELYSVMFSASGVAPVAAGAAAMTTPTPLQLLRSSLDALVADGHLHADRRHAAELMAWTVVHGFASLQGTGHVAIPKGRQRHAAVEALLEFTARGVCAPAFPHTQPARPPASRMRPGGEAPRGDGSRR